MKNRAVKSAQDLLKLKQQRKRAIVLEFTGTAKAGKSTMITMIENFFRRQNFIVKVPQEGAEVFRNIPRISAVYNIRTGIYALGNLIDSAFDKNIDMIILDRGVCDAYFWMEYWYEKKKINKQEMVMLQNFFTSPKFLCFLDLVFLLHCTPLESAKREMRNSLTYQEGEYMNSENLEMMERVFYKVVNKLTKTQMSFEIIENENISPKKAAEEVINKIFNTLLKDQ
jgi:thymidylate kinase